LKGESEREGKIKKKERKQKSEAETIDWESK